jgi:hypothetical protein
MNRSMSRGWCVAIVALAVGGLFTFTGSVKVFSIHEFAGTLAKHGVFRVEHLIVVAWSVAITEWVVGLTSIAASARLAPHRASLLLSGGLFMVFALYCLYLSRYPPAVAVGCGCGISTRPVEHWEWLGLRNAGASVGLAWLGWRSRLSDARSGGVDVVTSPPPHTR